MATLKHHLSHKLKSWSENYQELGKYLLGNILPSSHCTTKAPTELAHHDKVKEEEFETTAPSTIDNGNIPNGRISDQFPGPQYSVSPRKTALALVCRFFPIVSAGT